MANTSNPDAPDFIGYATDPSSPNYDPNWNMSTVRKNLNQATAISELAQTDPHYARALSGKNPPEQPAYVEPDYTVARILKFGVPISLVVLFITIIVSSLSYDPSERIPAVAGFMVLFFIIYCVSWIVGSKIEENQKRGHPIPPQPILYTLEPVRVEFLKRYLETELIFTLRYDIPVGFDQNVRALQTMLSIETEDVLDKMLRFAETRDAELHNSESFYFSINIDSIEGILVPMFGRAVYEAKVPVFRFKIYVKSPRSDVTFEHDIEIGEML